MSAACLAALPLFAAPEPGSLDYRIDQAKQAGTEFVAVDVFDTAVDVSATRNKGRFGAHVAVADVLPVATIAPIRPGALKAFAGPDAMTFEVPYLKAGSGSLVLDLVKENIFADDFKVLTAAPEANRDYDLGVHYRGVVRGSEGSIVAVSFFQHEVMGLVSAKDLGTIVIGRVGGENAAGDHIIYDRGDLQGMESMSCHADEAAGAPFKPSGQETGGLDFAATAPTLTSTPAGRVEKAAGDCVELYYETDYNIYQNKGSTSAVTSFVTGIHNQVAAIYGIENITTGLSQIFVWNTSNDPYTATGSSQLLSQFQNFRTSWNGDLAQVLKIGGIQGIAAGFSGICNSNRAESMSASFISSTYSNVPTYSDTVFVVSHEFGHTFGSRHTHACVWNGNNTAIDGCSGFVEGSCSLPGLPSGGGTIMSYCPNTSVGVNFNNAFGPQPG
ncbi:MAG: M12 family metallo-peptidase, partial [Acidobacteriota bacterium]